MIIDNIFYNTENPLGNRIAIPKQAGLYLVGNVILNPITGETFYLIKVGMSTNLYNRMKEYSTSNPMMFHIDYKIIEDENELIDKIIEEEVYDYRYYKIKKI